MGKSQTCALLNLFNALLVYFTWQKAAPLFSLYPLVQKGCTKQFNVPFNVVRLLHSWIQINQTFSYFTWMSSCFYICNTSLVCEADIGRHLRTQISHFREACAINCINHWSGNQRDVCLMCSFTWTDILCLSKQLAESVEVGYLPKK